MSLLETIWAVVEFVSTFNYIENSSTLSLDLFSDHLKKMIDEFQEIESVNALLKKVFSVPMDYKLQHDTKLSTFYANDDIMSVQNHKT